jgi:hypothetical protein
MAGKLCRGLSVVAHVTEGGVFQLSISALMCLNQMMRSFPADRVPGGAMRYVGSETVFRYGNGPTHRLTKPQPRP